MKITMRKELPSLKPGNAAAFFVTEDAVKDTKHGIEKIIPFKGLDLSYVKGKAGESHLIPQAKGPAVIAVGLGPANNLSREGLRNAAGTLADLCRARGIASAHIVLPKAESIAPAEVVSAMADGLVLSNYSFSRYKAKNSEDANQLMKEAVICGDVPGGEKIVREAAVTASNTLLCRDLINENSDRCNALHFAAEAKRIAKQAGVSCTILGKKEMEKLKMGLLLAVNRGSATPPQMVILHYKGDRKSRQTLALVGKGITFDSGGINLKPSGHIETMKSDMSGAAAVLYTLKTAAELKLPVNLYGVIPLTDNMLSNNSYRPGDVFISYSGKTVEIGNTDAEGRLILADAIAYIEKVLKPRCIVDMATLTGACIIALGECVAAYLTDHKELAALIENASATTGEKVWRLPIVKEYEENMKSDFADICNVSSEKNAGTIMGAIFIKNFVEKTDWMHIDIAGTSWYSRKRGYMPKYATGYGVRLLTEFARHWAKEHR